MCISSTRHPNFSDRQSVQTNEEGFSRLSLTQSDTITCSVLAAPPRPDEEQIKEKLLFRETDNGSTTGEEHLLDFDLSLFSELFGRIHNYSIFVRQGLQSCSPSIDRHSSLDLPADLNRTEPTPSAPNTYAMASLNRSLDYFAIFHRRSLAMNNSQCRSIERS